MLNLLPQAPKYIGVKLTGKLSGWTSPKVPRLCCSAPRE
jgi:hypothetical protein